MEEPKRQPDQLQTLKNVGYPINPDLVGYDYKKKVHFIYDVYTSNLSFIQTSKDLKTLGVKNNRFFLKLYDPALIGVNPYDKSLSHETIQRIIIEAMRNPWYFIREISRIPSSGAAANVAGGGDPFELQRANLAAIFCFMHNINFYMVIPRQCGKTQSVIAILLWTYLFGTTYTEMSFVNKDQDGANENLRRLKDQRDLLPTYLQQKHQIVEGVIKDVRGHNGAVQKIENPLNHNRIVTKPKATSLARAEGIGRGNTSPIQLFDEVEFTNYVGIISKAAGPAYVKAAENAAKNGAPYCRIYITTPGNVDSEPVESSKGLRTESAAWSDHMLDKSEKELIEYLEKQSRISLFYIEYSYRQIGKDEKWFQSMCRELTFDKIRIKRELLLQRIRGTSDSPFTPEDLDTINGLRKDIIEERVLNRIFTIRLYEKINPLIPYFIGVDCATATDNDNTAISIIDPYSQRAVGEAKSPLMNPQDLCTFLRVLIRDVCPRGILCIERNSLGDAIISMLKETEVRSNLYYDPDKYIVGNPDEKLDEYGILKRNAINQRSFGVFTQHKNREMMMQILMRLVDEKKDAFATAYIIDDLNNLVKTASGKIQARTGYHDDNIMSFLIAMFILYHGKDLIRWGYKPGGVPVSDDIEKPVSYEDVYNEMSYEEQQWFPAPQPKEDIYQQQLKEAIRRSQMERQNFSDTEGVFVKKEDQLDTDYYRMMNEDTLSEADDAFFADMNS